MQVSTPTLFFVGQRKVAEHLVKGDLVLKAHAEIAFGRWVHMDELAVEGKGGDAVGHVQEDGFQLVALALHFVQSFVERLRHVVEGAGQLADLVGGLDRQLLAEVAVGDALCALGDVFKRRGDGFGQQEREQDGDDQPEHHGLHDDCEIAAGELGNLLFAVVEVDDVAHFTVYCDRDCVIHVAVDHSARAAGLAGHCGDDVGAAVELFGAGGVGHRAGQVAAVGVQDGKAAVLVEAELGVVGRDDVLRASAPSGPAAAFSIASMTERVQRVLCTWLRKSSR